MIITITDIPPIVSDVITCYYDFVSQFPDRRLLVSCVPFSKILYDMMLNFHNARLACIDMTKEWDRIKGLLAREVLKHGTINPDFIEALELPSGKSVTLTSIEVQYVHSETRDTLHAVIRGKRANIDGEVAIDTVLPSAALARSGITNVRNREYGAAVIIVYTMLGLNSGQFWGFPPAIYDKFNAVQPSSLECFASPFNHVLPNYLSALGQIDKPLGSMGEFFTTFVTDVAHSYYFVNPPFVERVMEKTFDDVIRKLETANRSLHMLIYLPKWDDIVEPFHQRLLRVETVTGALPTKVEYAHLRKYTTVTYDYINSRPIASTFDCVLIRVIKGRLVQPPPIMTHLVDVFRKKSGAPNPRK